MALSEKLHGDRLLREKTLADHAQGAVNARKARLKGQVERLVKDAIAQSNAEATERLTESEGETESYDEVELDEVAEEARQDALCDALADRLREEDIEQDLGTLPTSEMVGRLCDDLGIKAPWARWDTQHWAKEEARRKVPGSPYGASTRRIWRASARDIRPRAPGKSANAISTEHAIFSGARPCAHRR